MSKASEFFKVSTHADFSNYQQEYTNACNQIAGITMSQMGGYGFGSGCDTKTLAIYSIFNLAESFLDVASTKWIHNKADGRATTTTTTTTPATTTLESAVGTIADDIKNLETELGNYDKSLKDLPQAQLTWSDVPSQIDANTWAFANSSDISSYNDAVARYNSADNSSEITESNEAENNKTYYYYNTVKYESKEAAVNQLKADKKAKADAAIVNLNNALKAENNRLTTLYNETQKKIEELEQKQAEAVSNQFATTDLGNNVMSDELFKSCWVNDDNGTVNGVLNSVNSDGKQKTQLLNTLVKKYTNAKTEKERDALSRQAHILVPDASSRPDDYQNGKNAQMLDLVLSNQTRDRKKPAFGA